MSLRTVPSGGGRCRGLPGPLVIAPALTASGVSGMSAHDWEDGGKYSRDFLWGRMHRCQVRLLAEGGFGERPQRDQRGRQIFSGFSCAGWIRRLCLFAERWQLFVSGHHRIRGEGKPSRAFPQARAGSPLSSPRWLSAGSLSWTATELEREEKIFGFAGQPDAPVVQAPRGADGRQGS